MAMLKNEISMLKAVAMKVDDKHILIATEQYHTEKTDDNKRNKDKSLYRWFAKVMATEDWQAYIDDLFTDEKRLDSHKIPNDTCGYFLCIGKSSSNYDIASWLQTKVNKAASWEVGQKKLNGWKSKTPKREEHFNPKAAYDTKGYIAEDGSLVDLTDKEALLKHVNQNLTKPVAHQPAKKANKIVYTA